jgi:hypothetical protein
MTPDESTVREVRGRVSSRGGQVSYVVQSGEHWSGVECEQYCGVAS